MISYATKPGSISSDGTGRNGLYTSKLLAQMDSNLQIEQSLKRVVTEVKAASQGKQEPWMEGSIEGDFCFAGCADGASAVAKIAPAVPAPIANGLSLDDIKKNQAIRGQWDIWQQAMKVDFDKVAALNAAADLQNTAWDRFLASYSQNNPYSEEDEVLRANAQSRKQAILPQQKNKNGESAVECQTTASQGAIQQYNLAQNTYAPQKDFKTALCLFEKAASAGLKNAQVSIGWAYMSNYLEMPPDYKLAMHWNLKAANQGFGRGSENIGLLYEKGWGVPVNFLEAANWYKKAISQGADSGQAQFQLGGLYEKGLGVQKDLSEAARLYQIIVEKNWGDAVEANKRLAILKKSIS